MMNPMCPACMTATADLSSRQAIQSASSRRNQVPRTKLKFGDRTLSFTGKICLEFSSCWTSVTTRQKNAFKNWWQHFLFKTAYNYKLLQCVTGYWSVVSGQYYVGASDAVVAVSHVLLCCICILYVHWMQFIRRVAISSLLRLYGPKQVFQLYRRAFFKVFTMPST